MNSLLRHVNRLLVILFLGISFNLLGQVKGANYFENTKGISKVKQHIVFVDSTFDHSSKLNYIYFEFDKHGNNIERYILVQGNKEGIVYFEWNEDGTLKLFNSYQSYSVQQINNELLLFWNKDELTNSVTYEYRKGNLVKVQSHVDASFVDWTRYLQYDNKGRITSEKTIYHPVSENSVLGFTSNSTELKMLREAGKTIVKNKKMSYTKHSAKTEYFVNGEKSGSSTQFFNKKGKLIEEYVYNKEGNEVYFQENKFNKKGDLISQIFRETGYDGFGDSYDTIAVDSLVYYYDEQKRVTSIENYWKGKLISTLYNTYIK